MTIEENDTNIIYIDGGVKYIVQKLDPPVVTIELNFNDDRLINRCSSWEIFVDNLNKLESFL